MTTDTVFAIFSTTKAITGTACLQLVEDGQARPRRAGQELRAGDRQAAGAGGLRRRRQAEAAAAQARRHHPHAAAAHGRASATTSSTSSTTGWRRSTASRASSPSSKAALKTPLLFDPGDDWEYGSNIDWAGQVVEGITGKRLGEVMQERIFAPLGMTSSGLHPDAAMRAAPRAHAPARGRRLAHADARLRAAAGPGGPHGRPRALLDGRRLLPLHPHVAERRHGRARPRAEDGDRAHGREERARRQEDQDAARRHRRACPTTPSSSPACRSPGR